MTLPAVLAEILTPQVLRLIALVGPDDLGCVSCGHVVPVHACPTLRCPACGTDMRQTGYVDGRLIAEKEESHDR